MAGAEPKWPTGLKRTKQRALVLDVLNQTTLPVTAAEISEQLERHGTPVWLSTVYRVLDTFIRHGLAEKSGVRGDGMAIYVRTRPEHRHYAVCVECHKIVPLQHCPLEHSPPQLEGELFQVLEHRLQIFGLCRDCGCGARKA